MAALSSGTPSISTKWAWYDDTEWKEYDDHTVRAIEACIRDGSMQVRVTFGSHAYIIDVDTMMQTNVTSQFRRMIKCLEIASGSDFECSWMWLDDQREWQVYPEPYASEINSAFLEGETSVDITFPVRGVYDIDFELLVQRSRRSAFTRRIQQRIALTDAAVAGQPEDPDHLCPICFESRNLVAMILPCRHVVCMGCARKLQATSGKCWCRGQIKYVHVLSGEFRPIFADR